MPERKAERGSATGIQVGGRRRPLWGRGRSLRKFEERPGIKQGKMGDIERSVGCARSGIGALRTEMSGLQETGDGKA